jgi:transglutaminase-like putative cysteine protease
VPDTTISAFYSPDGDLRRLVYGTYETEVLPESREAALAPSKNDSSALDLYDLIALKSDKPIDGLGAPLVELMLRFSETDLTHAPSDSGQTVSKQGNSWIVDIHPAKPSEAATPPVKPSLTWSEPGVYIPSDDSEFKELAHKITRDTKSDLQAALAIKNYVFHLMRPNIQLTAFRDAKEILKRREGMCGDYAILTTTLLRAAGIPSMVAGGLVTWDGTFFYHAWSEMWDGHRWLGIDATTDEQVFSAGHVKLVEGSAEDVQKMKSLGKPRIILLDAKH